jgi:hypothetical protein
VHRIILTEISDEVPLETEEDITISELEETPDIE